MTSDQKESKGPYRAPDSYLLQEKAGLVRRQKLDPRVLELAQDQFTRTHLVRTRLPKNDVRFLSGVALHTPAEPASLSKVADYVDESHPRKTLNAYIGGVNRVLKARTDLAVHPVRFNGETTGVFLGQSSWLDDVQSTRMAYFAAGYTEEEMGRLVGLSYPSIRNWLQEIYRWLGSPNAISAAMMLAENGQLDVSKLQQRIVIGNYEGINSTQKDILQTMTTCGLSVRATAVHLGLAESTVKNNIRDVRGLVGAGVNRVGLGIGFWLYNQQTKEAQRSMIAN